MANIDQSGLGKTKDLKLKPSQSMEIVCWEEIT